MAKKTIGLPPLEFGLLASEEQKQAVIAERVKEEDRRMVALAERMGIPDGPHRWYFLALELARLHVPELMPPKEGGRPRTWGEFELAVLAVEVERERKTSTPPKTILAATAALAKRKPWRDLLNPWAPGPEHDENPSEAIRYQYGIARKLKFTKAMREAFKFHEATGELHKWDAFVRMVKKET
ncbi:MAG: hypothetical protein ACK520_00215 [Inhella sp.]|jgi:hypothetical protein|uniref:hypothetical protein n=1 Tax=Inhella sp. TaxID=1921806 RepID=UPI0022BEDFC3|nr:hypothetical protein [Inhella sp.]MCZ8234357.1 hypothetical protein [Inhella sp.]